MLQLGTCFDYQQSAMTVAFGFSVGDFISAIGNYPLSSTYLQRLTGIDAELCAKVAKALNDTTGASAEYQHVVLELQALQNALSRLASLEPTKSNINHVNAIRGIALACQFPLREFLSNLEEYEKTMARLLESRCVE
jgi:hypothetical protein